MVFVCSSRFFSDTNSVVRFNQRHGPKRKAGDARQNNRQAVLKRRAVFPKRWRFAWLRYNADVSNVTFWLNRATTHGVRIKPPIPHKSRRVVSKRRNKHDNGTTLDSKFERHTIHTAPLCTAAVRFPSTSIIQLILCASPVWQLRSDHALTIGLIALRYLPASIPGNGMGFRALIIVSETILALLCPDWPGCLVQQTKGRSGSIFNSAKTRNGAFLTFLQSSGAFPAFN